LPRSGVPGRPGGRLNGGVLVTTTRCASSTRPTWCGPRAGATGADRAGRGAGPGVRPLPVHGRRRRLALDGPAVLEPAAWTEWLRRPGSELWVAWHGGAPAGYVEAHRVGPAKAPAAHRDRLLRLLPARRSRRGAAVPRHPQLRGRAGAGHSVQAARFQDSRSVQCQSPPTAVYRKRANSGPAPRPARSAPVAPAAWPAPGRTGRAGAARSS